MFLQTKSTERSALGIHHSLYESFLFNFPALSIRSDSVECTKTPASLGHFEKVGLLFKSNIMSPC